VITHEQYERWHDFAMRMARTCFKRKRNPSPAEIEANVEHFFECLSPDDLLSIVDWDNSDPYPSGCSRYRRTYKCPCWRCHGKKQLDCPYHCENGEIYDYAECLPVTDICKEHEDGWNPHYWSDEYGTVAERRHHEQFVGPVVCCIRAGLDLAVSPSAGVIGYTAGDLRRMYPEGVPDWITGGPGHRWSYAMREPPQLNGTFAEMPDTATLWL
jgi:hypothetical protein